MNQSEFALALGLTGKQQSNVSKWENGLRPPKARITAMRQLAAENNCSWDYSE